MTRLSGSDNATQGAAPGPDVPETPLRAEAAGTIYVLAPVHNRRALTERFARCLAAQTDRGFHLVLVDDGSTDGTADAVRSVLPDATIVEGKGDWWWAGSLEQARRWLLKRPVRPGDLVLIANDDTTFEPDFLAAARAALDGATKTLLLAQPYSAQTGERSGIGVEVNWRKLAFKPAFAPEDIDCFPTRGLFLHLEDFLALGGFHTILLPHYLSDYEFTIRAARRGFALKTDPAVRLVMDETATGIRILDMTSAGAYLRSVLTIKATKNPFYWSTFVLLASPRRHMLGNLVRVWRRFATGLADAARSRPVPSQ
jgi:GT2 family glycosyltransferase